MGWVKAADADCAGPIPLNIAEDGTSSRLRHRATTIHRCPSKQANSIERVVTIWTACDVLFSREGHFVMATLIMG